MSEFDKCLKSIIHAEEPSLWNDSHMNFTHWYQNRHFLIWNTFQTQVVSKKLLWYLFKPSLVSYFSLIYKFCALEMQYSGKFMRNLERVKPLFFWFGLLHNLHFNVTVQFFCAFMATRCDLAALSILFVLSLEFLARRVF